MMKTSPAGVRFPNACSSIQHVKHGQCVEGYELVERQPIQKGPRTEAALHFLFAALEGYITSQGSSYTTTVHS